MVDFYRDPETGQMSIRAGIPAEDRKPDALDALVSGIFNDVESKPLPNIGDYTPINVGTSFLTGGAGTGKTFRWKKRLEEDPGCAILAATTGIAAMNLGCTTLNSLLRFFDTASLRDQYTQGFLTSRLHKIFKKVAKTLVIDEISMMDGNQLEYIVDAMAQVNNYKDMEGKPCNIVLTGDFCQLPPVKAPWVFEMPVWDHFERNTEKLEKNFRQGDGQFLDAINAARRGEGNKAVALLRNIGVKFVSISKQKFDGTTIMSKNDAVDNYNKAALLDVPGTTYVLKRTTFGDEDPSWKNIPEQLAMRDGAYVMILANDISGLFEYANGDCGHVQGHDADGTIWIKLVRNEKVVGIKPILRHKTARADDADKFNLTDPFGSTRSLIDASAEHIPVPHLYCSNECGHDQPGRKFAPWGYPSFNCAGKTWNVGAVRFYPIRLAYATTVHKSQGLSLDRVQIDCRDPFFKSFNMAYVALSRCRTPEGLTIAGTPEKLAEAINLDPKVKRFL